MTATTGIFGCETVVHVGQIQETPNLAEAVRLQSLPSRARDAFETLAWWDGSVIRTTGALRKARPPGGPVDLWRPAAGSEVRDLALGFDDVLYVALGESAPGVGRRDLIRLVDRRDRWKDAAAVAQVGFVPEKLSAAPVGGVWALDVTHRLLARGRGLPLSDFQRETVEQFAPPTFRPVPEDPDPLRLETVPGPAWEIDETPVTLACSLEDRLALVTWRGTDEAWLHVREPDGTWLSARRFAGNERPYSLTWLSAERLAVLPAPRVVDGITRPIREALIFSPADDTEVLEPAGAFHPLRNLADGPWVQGLTLPVHYPVGPSESAPLVALSAPTFEREGVAAGRVLDSAAANPTWHRLNLEAVIPPGCGFVVELAATEERDDLPGADDWFPHHFGTTPLPPGTAPPPRGALVNEGKDLPLHPGLIGDDAADEIRGTIAGTLTVLIQRDDRRVRALRGRCLHVRVRLYGQGHATPRIYALRAWGSRFSYRDHHLAEVYREEVFGPEAEMSGPATASDFLDRFLGLFEGVLTPLEDHVAAAHQLTDPRSAPDESLDWLGSWIGEVFDAGFPPERRRAWLEAAGWLHRAHGTCAGLQLALELATGGRLVRQFGEEADAEIVFPFGGGVTGGEIVVLEEFRLQRTMATILGANLSQPDDPLLPGLIVSANSLVGETLILGETEQKEFLALFRHAFSTDSTLASEVNAVKGLFDRVAHRVTVLVHQEMEPRDLGLIRRVAARMSPAHVLLTVLPASAPLVTGLASLVDVDTYLVPRPPRGFARVDESRLGGNTFVRRLPALDPRLGGARRAYARPQARILPVPPVESGSHVTIDASTSNAVPGRQLIEFAWSWWSRP